MGFRGRARTLARKLLSEEPPPDPRLGQQILIGAHSYGFENVLTWQTTDRVNVGRYCSAAPGVVLIGGGNHPTNIATFPFRSRLIRPGWPEDGTSNGPIVIGHDVWIGHGAVILSGAEIGHGSIVAAEAVVRGQHPPYSLLAGNPARVVKRRFSEPTIDRLLQIAWWDWPDSKVVAAIDDFYGDVDSFIAKHQASTGA